MSNKPRVMITGVDGYIGWSLALHLKAQGYVVGGVDNGTRRRLVSGCKSDSVMPIEPLYKRCENLLSTNFYMENICSYASVKRIYREFRPDAIVYLSEIPSAPWSMNDYNAMETQYNNVQGTLATLLAMKNVCPDAHLIKLGTMGEYGTPSGTIIPEGNFPDGSRWRLSNGSDGGSLSGLPFPRSAGSWYHLSKVHDSYNVRFACNNYGLRSTDVMQGVVYGTRIDAMDNDPKLNTRFDIDECFGTAINRFCAQAVICHPITVYGLGNQKRGFLSLRDSIQCLQLSIDNPPSKGEYRVFNQFDEVYSLRELAEQVRYVGDHFGVPTNVVYLDNPRNEAEVHTYAPNSNELRQLGYEPCRTLEHSLVEMLTDLRTMKETIRNLEHVLMPKQLWSGVKCEQ